MLQLFFFHLNTTAIMMKYSFTPFLLANLLCCCFFIGLSVIPAEAVPVLQDRAKRPVVSSEKQSVIKKNVLKEIKVLGSFQNISPYKKSIEAARPELALVERTTPDTKVLGSLQNISPYKKSIEAARPELALVEQTTPDPKVLGSFQNISPYKKNIEAARPELALVEQKVPGHDFDSDTEQNRPQYSNKLRKKISAKSAIVMNATNGRTLFAVSPDTPRQPASTIKILTGLIAIKSLASTETVSISRKAAGQPSSKIYLKKEKQYNAHDLINAVLLSSANDASVALAEKIAGSEQSFARMMTLRAKLCGAQNTVCKTANGLTAKGQSSTARDLATIFKHAMQDEQFSQRMKQVKTHTAEGKLLRNHNKALWQIEGAVGGKTGFTNAAGQTYVGKFKRGSTEIIVAIMGSRTMWADLKTLVEYGFSQQESTVAKATKDKEKPKVIAGLPVISRRQ